jgi:sugar phosphate isomerase/epimerase
MKPLAIGACSGSFGAPDYREAFHMARSLGLDVIQLSGLPSMFVGLSPAEVLADAKRAGLEVVSASITHEGEDYSTIEAIRATGGLLADFDRRIGDYELAGQWLAEAGVANVTSHIGFVPERSDAARYAAALCQVQAAADTLARYGIRLALETGQETAASMQAFLRDLGRGDVGVNMDPANIILYGQGDPVEVLGQLREWVVSVHCKDAVGSAKPSEEWGREVRFGVGDIQAAPWLRTLLSSGYQGPLIIEREAGDDRLSDIMIAADFIRLVIQEL